MDKHFAMLKPSLPRIQTQATWLLRISVRPTIVNPYEIWLFSYFFYCLQLCYRSPTSFCAPRIERCITIFYHVENTMDYHHTVCG